MQIEKLIFFEIFKNKLYIYKIKHCVYNYNFYNKVNRAYTKNIIIQLKYLITISSFIKF